MTIDPCSPSSSFANFEDPPFADKRFALCLTHDVDRPYKTFQAPYRALIERDWSHLSDLRSGDQPWWQFETIQEIEAAFGVRSSFYFLNERQLLPELPKHAWIDPRRWVHHTGHYTIDDPAIVDIIERLDSGGWEIGLHGSYTSSVDEDRLAYEKGALESILGKPVIGGRQHFLNHTIPTTWRIHRKLGLRYDASLGSSTSYGFADGYDVIRPFGDDFLVFPLTAMEVALYAPTTPLATAKQRIDALIKEAAENQAIMSVLWHVRLFNEEDFPGYRELYRYLIEAALAAGAWVGSTGTLATALIDAPSSAIRPLANTTGTL